MTTFELKITAPSNEYPYVKRFSSEMKISELKEKLQLIVGTPKENMKLELRNKSGNPICALTDEQQTLASLKMADGMEVYVKDMFGNSGLNSFPPVEKYVLPDEKYNERAESVRTWRKREQLLSKANMEEESEKIAKSIKQGDRCVVHLQNQPSKNGTVSYVGTTQFKPGWYFSCQEKYGGFVRPRDVQVIQPANDVEMEEI
ncbi:unnamed protein product [Enterobius vermicularis]|uniref:CAP-Gly domain-containing protein n=1 Tax=Enterobius vermicularis TaxID=51028 RepID=A0A0N4V106_ENTVE|nr:unnamed protein product [Enterobius vermicularis]